jgi:hypothetical protein
MAKKKAIEYVLPLGGNGWVVKNNEAKKFTVITDSYMEAVSIARQIAKLKGRMLVVYSREGSIKTKKSYSDQRPAKSSPYK